MKFYGEVLVFILLLITNLRVFFVSQVRRDPLVVLAPFTFIVAILQIAAWGVDIFTFLGLLISFIVLLSNFHAIFRYIEYLYVDHYSPLMKVWAVLTILLTGIALAGTIYFAPAGVRNSDIGVSETKIFYKGSFRSGFEKAGPFSKKNLTIYEFAPDENEGKVKTGPEDIIVLLMPDKRADTEHYIPYLQQLASRGITVYSADFFADDCKWLHSTGDIRVLRRLVLAVHSVLNNQWFMGQREYYTYNISQEYNALFDLLNGFAPTSNNRFFLITDVMANTAAADLQKKAPEKIAGILNLDSISEYKTAGYGCVEQTDPILAMALGSGRDKAFFVPNLMAVKTVEALNDLK